MRKPVLLTVSGFIPEGIATEIAAGTRPRSDYLELAAGLEADLIDFAGARRLTGLVGQALARIGGDGLVLAYACWLLRRNYQVIVTDGEQVGLPLAALLHVARGARHAMIVHVLSARKKVILMDRLHLASRIDRFIVYSTWQQNFIRTRWKLAPERVPWTPFMVDHEFFAPDKVIPRTGGRPQICAVGLERRDYPTLVAAVRGLDVRVVIAAASPWSKQRDTSEGQELPDNVEVRRFTQFELRQLYADSEFLVMPLEPVDFQAGVTAILEAMAMTKPVLCSATPGQTDVVVEGENGRYVPPGDAEALRDAILQMLRSPEECRRLGTNARRLVEQKMSLAHYVVRLKSLVEPLRPIAGTGGSAASEQTSR